MARGPAVSLLLGLSGAVLGGSLATDWESLECTARGLGAVCVPGAARRRRRCFLVLFTSCATIVTIDFSAFLFL